jgi:hypothetical protein
MLAIYRRHNPKKCSSTDSQNCSNKRRPCPIWVRGSLPDGRYMREPMQGRDWTRALDAMRGMEATGERPTSTAVPEAKITIENWRDQFVKNARTENISSETIRKYEVLFRQLLPYTKDKGIRYTHELSLESLQEFRNSWKDKSFLNRKNKNGFEAFSNLQSPVDGFPRTPLPILGESRSIARNRYHSARTRCRGSQRKRREPGRKFTRLYLRRGFRGCESPTCVRCDGIACTEIISFFALRRRAHP